MVAKSIAKIYTNIHKPTDYSVNLVIMLYRDNKSCESTKIRPIRLTN